MKSLTRCLILSLVAGPLWVACQPGDTGSKTEPNDQGRTSSQGQVVGNLSRDFKQISERLVPSVVSISTQVKTASAPSAQPNQNPLVPPEDYPGGLGSGVIVDAAAGYILTNNHVIEGAERIVITLQNGKRLNAKLVGSDPPTDLAVLQVTGTSNLRAAVIGSSSQLKIGEWVLAIGSPFGLDSTVTAGIISAKGRANVGVADFEDFIQTDAAINPGNSGGALVNTRGELVGINTAIATENAGYMGVGFAIPSDMARLVMQDLIKQGKVTRSQLGVFIEEVDEDLRDALKLPPQQRGILVAEVIPETPAAESGFQKYDLIVGLNGEPVTEVSAFRNRIALTPPGTRIEVDVLRNGERKQLKPGLREAQAEAGPASARPQALEKQLGFNLEPLTDSYRQELGLGDGVNGLLVTQIEPSSTAYQRGLRRGDVLTEVNRQAVSQLKDIEAAIAGQQPGDAILLNIIRNGQVRILAFELPASSP